MADRPKDPDRRGYDWLYGNDEDDEATRRIPTSRRRPAASAGDDPEPTRMLPTRGREAPYEEQRRSRPSGPPPPPPRRPAPGRPPPGRSRRRAVRPRWGRIIGLVLLVWVLFLVAVPIWAWSQIEQVDAEPNGQRPEDTLGSTYLLVGSDSREGLTRKERRKLSTGNASGARTDTILLLHEPAFGGETVLLSLPRDSLVQVPGHGTEKINAAYAYGGPELLVRTVESETGLHVDNYIEIGLGGFVNVVDAVGGVEICPQQAMRDPKAGLRIQKGCQEVDGATALGYARSRQLYSTGDIGRAKAQREVMGKIMNKAASPWTVLNPFRYVSLASAGAEALRIGDSVGPIDLARFAWAMRKVSGDDALTCTVPIADLAVHWDEERALRLFELIREGETEDIGRRLCTKTGLPRS